MTTSSAKSETLWLRVREALHPSRLVPSLTAGAVAGVNVLSLSLALVAMLFAAPFPEFVPLGTRIFLLSATAYTLFAALTSSLPGAAISMQDIPIAILSLIAFAIIRDMPLTASGEDAFFTLIAAMILSSLLTGLFFLLLGRFRLGNLINFIPYPVIGGFLGGTGVLMMVSALSVMTGASVDLLHLAPLFQWSLVPLWVTGVFFALLLTFVLRRWSHFLILPGTLAAVTALFYLVTWLTGNTLSTVTAQGWLLGGLDEGGGGGIWLPLLSLDLSQVQWSVLLDQLGSLLVIPLVSVIALLLNVTGIELATGQEVDLNKELKAAGGANLFAAFFGGSPGYHYLGVTSLVHRIGGGSRLAGIFSSAILAAALFLGASFVAYLPRLLLGGLLFFLGLDFFLTWVYEGWFKLPRFDYVVMVLILLVIVFVGFLEGVAVGLLVMTALFVVNYSRIDVVRHALSGASYSSNVERPRLYRQLLRQKGQWIAILKLQGYIFFGSANHLLERVRQGVTGEDRPPHFVVLDFQLVTGLDSSAAFSFVKLKRLLAPHGIVLVLTGLSPEVRQQLERQVLTAEDHDLWRVFPDFDQGVAWCEAQSIALFESVGFGAKPKTLMEQLGRVVPSPYEAAEFLKYFETLQAAPGEVILQQGEEVRTLYFIEKGQVTARRVSADGQELRLRTMGAGTVAGEMDFYGGGEARVSLVADQPTELHALSRDALEGMEQAAPEVAAAFHRFMASLVSERLRDTSETLEVLLR